MSNNNTKMNMLSDIVYQYTLGDSPLTEDVTYKQGPSSRLQRAAFRGCIIPFRAGRAYIQELSGGSCGL